MTVQFFTLCDYAKNDGGSLTIIDTFDVVKATKLPWRTYFGFALKIMMDSGDADTKELSLSICSQAEPDQSLFNAKTDLAEEQRKGLLVMAGNVKGLIFEEVGNYYFKIYQDGQEIYSYIFKVELDIK